MVKKIYSTICFLVLIQLCAYAQTDFNRQYFNAKQFFREGKYNLAMEGFKPLIPYDQNNPFSEYASFYYALSAYNQGYRAVAKDQFNQIKTLHPKWDKMDEVNFWLGKIHLDNHDYFQGIKVLSSIEDKKLQKDIEALKLKALNEITDAETLKMMREDYPKDELVARALAKVLAKDLSNEEDKAMLESLIKDFNLERNEFIPEAPKTFYKDIYSVSVLMPFMVNTLDPSPAKKRNQIVLDFYEGMKLATDTLDMMGIKISLRAYDTERDVRKINTVLNSDELRNTDLLVGPFFQEENKVIQDFSAANRINLVNPFSNNSEVIGDNPFAFLYQPSLETFGKKSAEFLSTYATKKTCMVFYGTSKRDSVLAANFVKNAQENGIKIVSTQRIPRENVKTILATLATPTEYDEFRYPKEFTLKKDSLGSIFVATDDALIYTKVISGIETRNDGIVVLGSENWLDQTVVDLEKYQTLPIVLAAPNFTGGDNRNYRTFVHKFLRTHGRIPSNYAKMGYEFMFLMGTQLKKYGVYFQEGFNEQSLIPGLLTEGYNYQFNRNNHLIPFIRFEGGVSKVIDKR